jgi:hypothetical protein
MNVDRQKWNPFKAIPAKGNDSRLRYWSNVESIGLARKNFRGKIKAISV